jgi:hypothetical protein
MDTSGIRPQLPASDATADAARENRTSAGAKRSRASEDSAATDSVQLTPRAQIESSRSVQNEREGKNEGEQMSARSGQASAGTASVGDAKSASNLAAQVANLITEFPMAAAHAQANSRADSVLELLR